MNIRLVICFCLLLIIGAFAKKSRVFGGPLASISDFPHLVSIRIISTNELLCGGSIISRWNILTAAHCFLGLNNTYNDVKIVSGAGTLLNIYSDVHDIDYIIAHPQFRYNIHRLLIHDVAIVKLRRPIYMNELQSIIPLASRPARTENVALIAGWGTTPDTEGQLNFTLLRMTTGIIVDNIQCAAYFPVSLQNYQFCTLNPADVVICAGDSGNSVTIDGELYGIVSYTLRGARNAPVVHSQVYYYLDFIRRNMIE
ncbi:PREDICTED: trypsin-2-like [Ceratosolen solmsi marchali]|uniref:Trypsin-2-like n=1 Tax=Ceratosolen solmsi marchali TaxID=326594 RepID=A0AAJ7DUY9_9HYME|nr:PREDICTED: trypsin-2-like [Ceratosolen solmsi marchali]